MKGTKKNYTYFDKLFIVPGIKTRNGKVFQDKHKKIYIG